MNNKQKALDLINAYLEKQNKTELSKHKIELRADLRNLKSIKTDSDNWLSEVDSELSKVSDFVVRAEKALRNAEMWRSSIDADIKEISKELEQYDMNPNSVPIISDAKNQLKQVDKRISDYKSKIQLLK
jgi:phosphoglycerate-specific signal transduction histidine kinase